MEDLFMLATCIVIINMHTIKSIKRFQMNVQHLIDPLLFSFHLQYKKISKITLNLSFIALSTKDI